MYKNLTKTVFTGHNLVYLTTCHSTNEYASRLLSQRPVADGTVIITDNQTVGKGQRGNNWESQPGKNLTLSIMFKPTFLMARNNFWLNPTISLGVADFLADFLGPDIRIKWPNDIYFNDLKIGGILIENSVLKNEIADSIIGIGINVNQREFGGLQATSMALETQMEFDLAQIWPTLISRLESRYLQLRSDRWPEIKSQYLGMLYRINELHDFKSGEVFEGMIIGVDDIGRLQIRRSDGTTEAFDIKAIEYL